jgi:CRP-like cAMP-binding protein
VKTISCKSCQNAECFVKLCSEEWIEQADGTKSQTLYKKNQSIIKEGAQVWGVFFIQKGKVKVFSSGLNGREQIVRFAADGHILGHRGIGHDVYPISAVAMEDSFVCFIRNETLNDMFLANPKFPIALMMYYSVELRKLESRMKNIAQMNIRGKIAETLLLMLDNFGVNSQNELNVPFSREDIASAAGSTRQQVVMQLTEFEKDGYIEKRGKKIALTNTEGLEKIICKFNLHSDKSKLVSHKIPE